MTLKNLIQDIYSLLDPAKKHVSKEENLARLSQGIAQAVSKALEKPERPEEDSILYMSNIGVPARKLWYQNKYKSDPVKQEVFTPAKLLSFLYGNVIEELLLFLVREAGYEVTDEQKRVEIEGVRGKLDCKINGVVVDVKSSSDWAFKKFSQGDLFENDEWGYVPQISGYAQVEGSKESAFLAMNKSNGELALLELNELDHVDVVPLIKHIKETLKKPEPPERCYQDIPFGKGGNRELCKNCQWCPFKEECWADSNGGKGLRKFDYSDRVIYMSKVVSEPKVPEIA